MSRPSAPPSPPDAYGIGLSYEAGLSDSQRTMGAHFTPPDVAQAVVSGALSRWFAGHSESGSPVICDPTCGGGVFLLAAGDHLVTLGYGPRQILEECLVGLDLDSGAVDATAQALRRWGHDHGVTGPLALRVSVGDALLDDFASSGSPAIDVIVGNPPFQNQLDAKTARTAEQRVQLLERFGNLAKGYVDIASLVLWRSLELVSDGGVVCMILPRSALVARDSAAVRTAALRERTLVSVWIPGEHLFVAKVWVIVPTILASPSQPRDSVSVLGGRLGEIDLGRIAHDEVATSETWSTVWAVSQQVPRVNRPSLSRGAPQRNVGDIAQCTAGFRDQYYGLLDHMAPVGAGESVARIVTTAMIDPAYIGWGHDEARIAKQRWLTPWLNRTTLAQQNGQLSAWVERLMVPKVLIATQTKVIEAAADLGGDLVPFTPVIAAVPSGEIDAAHIEAALLAPPATAWALHHFGGGGLSATSLKLAARQVAEVPLPSDSEAWSYGVELLTAGPEAPSRRTYEQWVEIGRVLTSSWGIENEMLIEWWVQRMAKRGLHWPTTS